MYRRFFKPRHAAMWRRAKELAPAGRGGEARRPPVRVMLHCCGGVRSSCPTSSTRGSTPSTGAGDLRRHGTAGLKRDFGSDLVFWAAGAIPVRCSPTGPRAGPRPRAPAVEILARDGGFVFQQVHNIQANVPAPNVEAMFDAVRG